MKTINFNNCINEIKSKKNFDISCTLLIPKLYLGKIDKIKKLELISIEVLLKRYSKLVHHKTIKINPIYNKHTTSYQNSQYSALNLNRLHFRCDPMVWHHWKRLANHYGVSMCFLFFICLKNVEEKDLKSVGTPTEKWCFHNFIFFEVSNFNKYYSHRWINTRLWEKNKKK